MDQFRFGRTAQSPPKVIIEKEYMVHPSQNLGFRNHLRIQCFVCSHSFFSSADNPHPFLSLSPSIFVAFYASAAQFRSVSTTAIILQI
jgi:hypothetical protein